MSARYTFRALEPDDFELLARWIGAPHVQRWWREPATVEHVEREYGGCTRGDERTRVFVALLDGREFAMIQCYAVEVYHDDARYPTRAWDAAGDVGIDYLIGAPELTGRGHGAGMIRAFVESVIAELYPGAGGVVAGPELANASSLGALRRAGFREHKALATPSGKPTQLMRRAL